MLFYVIIIELNTVEFAEGVGRPTPFKGRQKEIRVPE
jgi:hypothetical protein